MSDQPGGERIIPINIENEMRTAYIDYSMSVIVSRALPDVRAACSTACRTWA
jgi:DNA gyrase subunit A